MIQPEQTDDSINAQGGLNLIGKLNTKFCPLEALFAPLRKEVERRRVGSVIKGLILVAGKMVRHAGKVVMKLAISWSWTQVVLAVDRRILGLQVAY